MKLDQLFYGRGPNGYQILGSSIPSCGLTDRIQEICQAVGTPGFERQEDDVPFLLQQSCGLSRIMICGRNGTPDSLGRRTLFFHALVADKGEAERLGVSALALYENRTFASVVKDGTVKPIDVSALSHQTTLIKKNRFSFPAVILAKRSESMGIVGLLGSDILTRSWATFTWNPLDGFDFYCLDSQRGVLALPPEVNIYNQDGSVFNRMSEVPSKEVSPKVEKDREGASCSKDVPASPRTSFLSVIVAFVIGCLVAWFASYFVVLYPSGNESQKTASRPQNSSKVKLDFDQRNRILDFDKLITEILTSRQRKDQAEALMKMKANIDFVNNYFKNN